MPQSEENYIVTLTDQNDPSRTVSAPCSGIEPCQVRLSLPIGNVDADIEFTMRVSPPVLEVFSVRWPAADGYLEFRPAGSGGFRIGRSVGTLWLVRMGGVLNPVLRDPKAFKVARINVSVLRRKSAPLPANDQVQGHAWQEF